MVKVTIMITMNRRVCNEMNVKGIYWQQAGNLKHEADSTGSGLLLLHVICGAAQFASCAAQSPNHTCAPQWRIQRGAGGPPRWRPENFFCQYINIITKPTAYDGPWEY